MNMANDGWEHQSRDSAETTSTRIPPTVIETMAIWTVQTPTVTDACMPFQIRTASKQQGTSNPVLTDTTSSESCNSKNIKKDGKELSCVIQWLGHSSVYRRILDYELLMLAHHVRQMGNNTAHIIKQAVNMET